MLEVQNLTVHYGPIPALRGVSLRVGKGEIVALIGANGAGKTTTLSAISGLHRPSNGKVMLEGRDVTALPPQQKVALGITHVPEGRRIFPDLTVRENLEMGAYLRRGRDTLNKALGHVYDLFPRLKERQRQVAGTLSGGEQQMLAMGRALMAEPKVLLLDEPSLGLAPLLVNEIFNRIAQLNREGLTILLVEQNAHKSLALAHRAYVMEIGVIAMEGEARALAADARIRDMYLGKA